MQIKQDPITKLWCREDGAVLLPPDGYRFKTFRWTFGSKHISGYLRVGHNGKSYKAHQVACRAFHGLPPEDKPFVDHINRRKDDNRPSNLHWVDRKENNDNTDRVDRAIEMYGVRCCDDKKAYSKACYGVHREERLALHNAYCAEKKAQGLVYRKCSDGKQHWVPEEVAPCM